MDSEAYGNLYVHWPIYFGSCGQDRFFIYNQPGDFNLVIIWEPICYILCYFIVFTILSFLRLCFSWFWQLSVLCYTQQTTTLISPSPSFSSRAMSDLHDEHVSLAKGQLAIAEFLGEGLLLLVKFENWSTDYSIYPDMCGFLHDWLMLSKSKNGESNGKVMEKLSIIEKKLQDVSKAEVV